MIIDVSVYGTVTHVLEKKKEEKKRRKKEFKRGLARCPINYLVSKGHLVFDDVNIVLGLWTCSRKCMSAVCASLTGSSDSPLFYTMGCQSKVLLVLNSATQDYLKFMCQANI